MKALFGIGTFLLSGWILLSTSLYAQAITEVDGRYQASVERVFDIPSAGRLNARIIGRVVLTSWDRSQVRIREQLIIDAPTYKAAQDVAAQALARYTQRRGTVSIDDDLDGYWREYERSEHYYEVTVPRAFDVDIENSVQDISIEGLQGDVTLSTIGGLVDLKRVTGTVEIHTIGAEIKLADVGKDVTISTQRSDIRIEQAEGNVSIEASGGAMTLQGVRGDVQIASGGSDVTGAHFEGAVEIYVDAGDIKLTDVRASIEAGTSVGDVEVNLSDRASHEVHLYTQEGTITLVFPGARPAEITAEIWLVGAEFGSHADILTDFLLTQSAEVVEYQRRVKRARGRINGGGKAVFLKTYGGDIHIRKEE